MVDEVFVTNVFLEAQAEGFINNNFLVDAILTEPAINFDVDAFLSTTNQNDFLADALLQGADQLFFYLVDAFLSTINQHDFDVDANLIEVKFQNFDVDAILIGQQIFQVDAQIVRIVLDFPLIGGLTDVKRHDVAAFDSPLSPPFNFAVDAILDTEHFSFAFSDVHYQDIAHFITPPGVTFSVDAVLTVDKFFTFDVDAIIQPQPTVDIDVDALLLGVNQNDFDVDAILLGAPIDNDFDVDAVLLATQNNDFNVDAFISQPISRFYIVDALLLGPEILFNYDVDAFLSVQNTFDFDVDAILNVIHTFDVDAIIDPFNEVLDVGQVQFEVPPPPEGTTFLVDALLQATIDNGFNVDAFLSVINQNDFLVDAVLAQTVNNDFDVDAVLLEVQFQNFDVDAILIVSIFNFNFDVDAILDSGFTELTFLVDAVLANRFDFDVDALLLIIRDNEFLVDAHLVINARLEHTSLIREDLNITSLIRVRKPLP